MNERFRGHITQKAGEICDKVFNPFLNYMDGKGKPPRLANVFAAAAGVFPASADIAAHTDFAAAVTNGSNIQHEVPAQVQSTINTYRSAAGVSAVPDDQIEDPQLYHNKGSLSNCDAAEGVPNIHKDACFREVEGKIKIEPGTKTNSNGEKEFHPRKFCYVTVRNPDSEACHQAVWYAFTGDGFEFKKTDSGKVKLGEIAVVTKIDILQGIKAGFTTTDESIALYNKEKAGEITKGKLLDAVQGLYDTAKCAIAGAAIAGSAWLYKKRRR